MTTTTRILVLGTGGTIAGAAASATSAAYQPGGLALEEMLGNLAALGLAAELIPQEVARIGSQDIGWPQWQALHTACAGALADPAITGVIITHGTDTAEETAFLLDLTLPTGKPVVLVGAMRSADAVGADGMRNFANAVRVASDPAAAGRGVLLVMGDAVLAARDARKAATSSIDAFKSFPRGAIARVTRQASTGSARRTEWVRLRVMRGPSVAARRDPYRRRGDGRTARCGTARYRLKGVVLAGMGQGNAPACVLAALAQAAAAGVPVVRSTRVDEGIVDRNVEVDDDAHWLRSRPRPRPGQGANAADSADRERDYRCGADTGGV